MTNRQFSPPDDSETENKKLSYSTAEIPRDANETAIQGQSRSSVVVSIDATYTTSY